MNAKQKLISARARLILDAPFWGALALNLPLIEDPTCETAWVNGRELGYNPAFIESLDMDETRALLAHEVSHCAQGHPYRRDARDPEKWNEACDKVINHDLKEAKFKLPLDPFIAQGDEVGKSAEWIYAREQQKPKQKGGGQKPGQKPGQGQQNAQGQGQGQGQQPGQKPQPNKLGEVRDAPKTPDAQGKPAPTEQDWKQHVQQAQAIAKSMGNMPAGGKRIAERGLKPQVDVKSLLMRFFQDRTAADFSWMRPSRRYMSQGLYLPSLHSTQLGEIVLLIDTSGSVTGVNLDRAKQILMEVIEECNPAGITVYFVDAKVQNVQRMERGDALVWEPRGGGGTDFRSFFKDVDNGDVDPVCIIGITDLYATFPEVEPHTPVLWLSTTEDKQAPWGETVYAGH